MVIFMENIKLSIDGTRILDDVKLHVETGQIYGIIGPNGAGKSSTIAIILGLYVADSGKLELFGETVGRPSIETKRCIGVLPERAGFYHWMNACDYLTWYAELCGGLKRSIPELLALVGLAGVEMRPIGQFSQGMCQRLALARALVHRPRLLILDEPTSGLDPRGRREIHDLLLYLSREQGVSILLSTHLLDDVDRLCDRIGIIHQGRTVLEGSLSELLNSQDTGNDFRLRMETAPDHTILPKEARLQASIGGWWHLHLPAGTDPADMWRQLMDHGWRIQEILVEADRLEGLYINMTHTAGSAGSEETI
jgi:ABC-2 type transport system ATP-binding protein